MIYGIGTDIVAIGRMEAMLKRYGDRAVAKLLAATEREEFRAVRDGAAFLARRFAAKEALGKALGLGLRDPATLHSIAIAHDALGRPRFDLAPALAGWLQARQLTPQLSLSDDNGMAVAFVVIEQRASNG